jgi:hypothetical protein
MLAPAIAAVVLVLLHFAYVGVSLSSDWDDETVKAVVDLSTESNAGTWLSAFLVLASAAVAAVLAQRAGGRDGRRWALMAFALLVVSVDEVAAVHEAIGDSLDENVDIGSGVLRYEWVVPAAVLVVVVVAVLLPFVLRQPAAVAVPLLAAAAIYVAGALGFEMLEGWLDDRQDPYGTVNVVVRGVQEVLELAGELLGLWALLGAAGTIEVRVEGERS